MNVDAKIAQALFTHLDTAVFVPDLPVAWPNVRFTQPGDDKFLRARLLPNDTEGFSLGSTRVFMGFLQVDVNWPLAVGIIEPKDMASQIQDRFAKGTRVEYQGVQVEINDPPFQGQELIDAERLIIVVSVPYRAHV